MRYCILLFFFLLVSCGNIVFPSCVNDPCVPVPGATKLNDAEKTSVAAETFGVIKRHNPNCTSFNLYKIVDTSVANEGIWKYGDNWVEIWAIEACGDMWKVPVKISIDNKTKNIFFSSEGAYKLIDGKYTKVKAPIQ
jgi:hypothetical protein